uniref:Uncharacterized protein n=1 Tax=Candidatus Kentrum sp. FM TaxID=2126340 RepID=A0A450SBQ3_9GAMM|nr:MAG: hypothetical protein BECKFM1743C_GA0114222_100734 [Candidatus Kentron sp. FM]
MRLVRVRAKNKNPKVWFRKGQAYPGGRGSCRAVSKVATGRGYFRLGRSLALPSEPARNHTLVHTLVRWFSGRLLLDSGLMADLCNYPSGVDMDRRMFGGEYKVRPYAPPNVGANLVFAHYAQFAFMPKSCGFTALSYMHSVDQPGIR